MDFQEETTANVSTESSCTIPFESVVIFKEELDFEDESHEEKEQNDEQENNTNLLPDNNEIKIVPSPQPKKTPLIKCNICGVEFKRIIFLEKHLSKHSKKITNKCEYCGREFRHNYLLQDHLFTHTNYCCNICKRRFRLKSELKVHLQIHNLEEYKCKFCEEIFQYKSILNKHLQTHVQIKLFHCEPWKSFVQDCSLKEHNLIKPSTSMSSQESFHTIIDDVCTMSVKEEMPIAEVGINYVPVNDPLEINDTDVVFPGDLNRSNPTDTNSGENDNNLLKKSLDPLSFEDYQIGIEPDYELNQLETSAEKQQQLKCTTCQEEFASISNMESHMNLHYPEKKYKCDFCGKEFSQKCIWNSHLHSHSLSDSWKFKCKICGLGFNNKASMNSHVYRHVKSCRNWCQRRTNVNIQVCSDLGKLFTCPVCGKGLNQKSHMKRHMLVHTKQKSYSCAICGQDFQQNSDMKRHLYSQHVLKMGVPSNNSN